MFIQNKNLQEVLIAAGYLNSSADGIIGPKTLKAAEKILNSREPNLSTITWTPRRQTVAAVQIVLKFAGYSPGPIDGFDGHLTQSAYEEWAIERSTGRKPVAWRPDDIPQQARPNVWGSAADLEKNFGKAGGPQCTAGKVQTPFKLRLAWDLGTTISTFSCHERVARSFTKIYDSISSRYSESQIKDLGLDIWGGCYNFRAKRGGSTLSTHAYGIAVDFDPIRNQLKWNNTQARLAKPDANIFFDAVYSEGFISLGREKNFDWMHCQAVSL